MNIQRCLEAQGEIQWRNAWSCWLWLSRQGISALPTICHATNAPERSRWSTRWP